MTVLNFYIFLSRKAAKAKGEITNKLKKSSSNAPRCVCESNMLQRGALLAGFLLAVELRSSVLENNRCFSINTAILFGQ